MPVIFERIGSYPDSECINAKGLIRATYLSLPPQWLHVGGSRGSISALGVVTLKPKDSSIRAEIFSIGTEEPGAKKP